MITIDDWIERFKKLPQVTIHSTEHVEGICDILSGERFHYAKIGITFSPSDKLIFSTSLSDDISNRCKKERWIESLCMGVLDIMLLGPMTPINQFDCVIDHVEYHEKRSSNLAFRLAARVATKEFLSKQTFNGLWP